MYLMLSKSDLVRIQSLVLGVVKESEKRTKNEILKSQDKVMGRLDKIDEELAITNGYKVQLEDHETRIVKMEKRNLTQ